MSRNKVVGRAWYFTALIPFAIGVAVAVSRIAGVFSGLADMPRVVVPGKGEVTLAAGDYSVFGESRSTYQGTAYVASSLQLRCEIHDPAGGAQPELTTPIGSETYSIGAYAGQKMFKLSVPHGGTFQVACDGQGGPATLAFGGGLIMPLFVGIIAFVGGLFVAGGVFTLIFVRRRNRQRAAAAAA